MQRREFALHPGYTKLYIFGKLKDRAMNLKEIYLDQPVVDLPEVHGTFSNAAVKISSSLEYQKKTFSESVQSQLRFIPKLHNQGFTCTVFYPNMKLPLLCRLHPVSAGQCYTVIHPGTLWDTLLDFELSSSFIVI